MPPKSKPAQPSKKADLKRKEKIIEDKTFGLKNKKGAKTQKFIQQVQHQVKHGGQSGPKKFEEQKRGDSKKEEKKKELAELNMLFKPVAQKVEKGADPKSVLCAFHKQGMCSKGDKCKFSHDLTVERKAEKRSAYVDMREDLDGMENWDEEKLKEVINTKHAEADQKKPKTEIICKYFLEALEKSKYGWFWECPNGEKCFYRHCLPPGFVLNKDKKKDDKKGEISIEDLVEKERAILSGTNLTKITLESFLAWKKKKIREKKDTYEAEEARKKAEFKAGKSVGLSGREMFSFRPELAAEDEMDEGDSAYDTSNLPRDEDEDLQVYREITLEALVAQASEVDGTGTVATKELSREVTNTDVENTVGAVGGQQNGVEEPTPDQMQDVPIDENLFIDEDIDELDEELEAIGVTD